MIKPETKFANALCPKLRERGWFVQRIESGETGSGIPDIYLSKGSVQAWLELKAMDVMWPTDMKIDFRPGQWPWLHTNAQHGGTSYLGVKVSNGYVFSTIHDVDPTYHIQKAGRPILYLPTFNVATLDLWLLGRREPLPQ